MTTNSFDITLSTRTLQFVLPKMNTAYHTYNMILRILGLKFSIVLYAIKPLASLNSNLFFDTFSFVPKNVCDNFIEIREDHLIFNMIIPG